MQQPKVLMNVAAFNKLSGSLEIKITHFERDSYINGIRITLLPPIPELEEDESYSEPEGYPV